MSKVIKLNLEHGDFHQGFQSILEISDDRSPHAHSRTCGELPANMQVCANYENWRRAYRSLETAFRRPQIVSELEPVSVEECQTLFKTLKDSINDWLLSEEFRPVRDKLLRKLDPEEEVRFIIRTSEHDLRKLPWEIWDFFNELHNTSVAISPTENETATQIRPKEQVKILAILGDSRGINIEEDREILNKIPQADVHFLVEPTRQDLKTLWDEEWHILFFAGHSYSDVKGEEGRIYLNENDALSISELKNTLKKAISNGLQLAIFNSCDGLGLANKLQRLNIPQMIVMREPVPDKFAQKFLEYFLDSFSGGQSLYTSVREAREQLHDLSGIEQKFPGASLLPVICQHPSAPSIKWEDFIIREIAKKPENLNSGTVSLESRVSTKDLPEPSKESKPKLPKYLIAIGFLGGVICLSTIGVWFAWLRPNSPICSLSDNRISSKIAIPQKQQLINYGGSTSWVPIAEPFHEEIKTALPGFQLNSPKYSGSVEGIQQVLGGFFAFSLSSANLQDEDLVKAKQQGYELIQEPVAIDAIAVGVNPQLEVPHLTLTQLKDIYTGKIRNWREVGGADIPITPYSREPDRGGTVQFFSDAVLGGQPLNPQIVKFVDSTTTGVGKVNQEPGGIYYASAPEIVPQCGIRPLALGLPGKTPIAPYQGDLIPPESCPQQRNQINSAALKSREYPLTRNLFVIIKDFPGEDDAQEQAGRAYADLMLTGKGQAMVEEHEFVPIARACPLP
ncbi:MAG: substrate-binding domain-containing protein [Cyanobacteriota bacterium]|nr:substrate-binding domain-containing protein [Cyanobacteriota bacterium]